jgi:CubicO group peptidase (beta-lactamase class C family)
MQAVADILNAALGSVFTCAVARVYVHGEIAFECAIGTLRPDGPKTAADSIFDLASLTKLFSGTALLALFDRRAFALDDPIVTVIPEFAGRDMRRAQVTFRQLLTHASGLPAHVNFRDELGAKAVINRVCSTPLAYAPGTDVIYSDLGFMLLGEAISRLARKPLQDAIRELAVDPLELETVMFRPHRDSLARIACTENDTWRGRLLCGEVHDENCWAMGGVAGHAGLFGTAAAVAELADSYLMGGALDLLRVLLRPTAVLAVREQARSTNGQERRGLAWALKVSDETSSGRRFSMRSFGHTGYTGTSVWVDPTRALTVVLLTNRVHLSRNPEEIRALRIAVHDAVVDSLESSR